MPPRWAGSTTARRGNYRRRRGHDAPGEKSGSTQSRASSSSRLRLLGLASDESPKPPGFVASWPLPSCLPCFLASLASLPPWLPYPPTYLPPSLASSLATYLPLFLPASQPASQPACPPACLSFCLLGDKGSPSRPHSLSASEPLSEMPGGLSSTPSSGAARLGAPPKRPFSRHPLLTAASSRLRRLPADVPSAGGQMERAGG